MDSIAASRDGRTAATAYTTISVAEGYDVMYLLGIRAKQRSIVNGDDGYIVADVFTFEDEHGNELRLHFSPRAHFARLHQDRAAMPPELLEKLIEATVGKVETMEDVEQARKMIKTLPDELQDQLQALIERDEPDPRATDSDRPIAETEPAP